MDAVAFAYYFLMLAVGLKIIHAFYSHFKKKKKGWAEGTRKNSLSLFGGTNHSSDSSQKKGRNDS